MAIRGRGKGLEPRIPTKPAAPVKQAVAPVPEIDLYTMPPQQLPQAVIAPPKGQPIQIPVGVAPVVAPPVAVAPPPPPVAPAPAPVPIPQIDPAVLAQIQEQFNIPAPAPAPAPVKEVAPPPPVQVAPPRIEEPPKAPPPVQVPPPSFRTADFQDGNGNGVDDRDEPVAPPPPAAVAPPPPPPPVQPQVPPAIPQIDPEILAQIQQQFNIPAAPPAPPPVAPPVQVPPPVMQPAPPPPAAVAPPPPPVQVPPPTFVDEFEEPLAMDGMRGGPRSGIGSLPEAPPEAVAPPPVQVPPPVVQAEPVAPPVVPPPVTPTIDPSLYSDPNLGVEPGAGDTRGGSPMGPRELMGSNYIEPKDGPGQVPPGQRVDVSEPTGIETVAESVGQGDYLGESADTIQLPDGSTFNLGNLDLSGIGQDLGGFELGNVNPGGVDPSLYSDPDLGGGQEPEFDRGNIGFGPVAVDGGYSYDGNGNEINGGPAGGAPVFNPPQGAVDEAFGTTFTPDLSNLDLSGLNLNLGEGFDAGGFEPDFTFGGPGQGGPNGGPGMGNGPGNNMGNQGGDPYNPTVNDTDNPYPFIPDGVNIDGMTPDALAGLNNFYEMYPDGFDYSGMDFSGIGNIDLSGVYPGGNTGTGDGNYTVTPVDPVGDLGVGDDTGDASDPIDVTTPYVPPDVRSASSFGLTGATQTMPVSANPFRRPESQQGLGSLAGGG